MNGIPWDTGQVKERSKARVLGLRAEDERGNEAEKGGGEKPGESEISEAKEKGVSNCGRCCFGPDKQGTEKHSDIFLVNEGMVCL